MHQDTPVSIPAQGGGFAIIPNWLIRDASISANVKMLYALMSSYAGRDGVCFPSQRTIGDVMGMDPRSVRRVLAEMKELGLVESWIVTTNRGRANRYRLLVDRTGGVGQARRGGADTGVLMGADTGDLSIEEEPREEEPLLDAGVEAVPTPVVTQVTARPATPPAPSRPTPLPRGWKPSPAALTSFTERFGKDIELDLSLARFVAYYVEHNDKLSRDWTAKCAQWLAKDAADVREKRPDPNGPDEFGNMPWQRRHKKGQTPAPSDARLDQIMAEMDKNRRQQ